MTQFVALVYQADQSVLLIFPDWYIFIARRHHLMSKTGKFRRIKVFIFPSVFPFELYISVENRNFRRIGQPEEALKILKFHVPPMVPENSDVKLNCIFELNGFQLYSVKWYKDQTEFYSFVPRENPPIQTFRTEGIKVDLTRSKIGSVYIRNVKQSSEGTYKCELSGESPYFPLEYKTRIMKVYLAPKHAPIISGYANSYKVGDYVSVNCTSDRSKPGVHLKWYVGDSFVSIIFEVRVKLISVYYLERNVFPLRFRDFHLHPAFLLRSPSFLNCHSDFSIFDAVHHNTIQHGHHQHIEKSS
ncbi:Cell adhesion molecule 3 [Nymphon striatum]|nr:Cell adhesion molecule 3 [Nymphon striatum]